MCRRDRADAGRSLLECREQALLHSKAVVKDADNPEVTRDQQAAAARDILKRTKQAIVTVCRLKEERGTKARASTTDNDARAARAR